MRVLTLSLDKKVLENGSAVQRRLIALAEEIAEKTEHHPLSSKTRVSPSTEGERQRKESEAGLTVFVPGERDEKREVSTHLTVHAFGGPKAVQLWKMWRAGKKHLSGDSSFSKGGGESASRRISNPSSDSEVGVLPLGKGELTRYDLITVQDVYFLGFLAVKLAEKFHISLEVQLHGFEQFSGLRKKMALFVLSKATRVRAVSQRLKALAVEFGVPAEKVYILPVYTQIEPQRATKQKTVPYPFTFLTVGRLVPVKNIALQIKAFAKLIKQIPHVRLQIVGGGPELERLKLEARSSKLDEKISFEGEQKDVGKFYEEADAFLLTSDRGEGWGLVALEAAAYRLPVIMTNVGLANEVLHHDKECIVVPVGDEQQLLGAMKELVEHPELRERLLKAAYAAFRALPSAEEQIAEQVAGWQEIISRK